MKCFPSFVGAKFGISIFVEVPFNTLSSLNTSPILLSYFTIYAVFTVIICPPVVVTLNDLSTSVFSILYGICISCFPSPSSEVTICGAPSFGKYSICFILSFSSVALKVSVQLYNASVSEFTVTSKSTNEFPISSGNDSTPSKLWYIFP